MWSNSIKIDRVIPDLHQFNRAESGLELVELELFDFSFYKLLTLAC